MCKIPVRVVPNSSRTSIISFIDGVLKVKVMEPPEDGRANRAVIKSLSKKIGIKNIKLCSGEHSRDKIIDFGDDVQEETVISKLFQK